MCDIRVFYSISYCIAGRQGNFFKSNLCYFDFAFEACEKLKYSTPSVLIVIFLFLFWILLYLLITFQCKLGHQRFGAVYTRCFPGMRLVYHVSSTLSPTRYTRV